MSMQVKQAGYRIEVTPILIEHRSKGNYNHSYWDDCLLFHQKWHKCLPIGTPAFTPEDEEGYYRNIMTILCYDQHLLLEKDRMLKKVGYYKLGAIKQKIRNLFKRR
jgi:hypothetical protein